MGSTGRLRSFVIALCALAGALSATILRAAEPRAANVLFLICDDLNCDLGCYGHAQVRSPNIDRLAARGLRFERAYCQYPLCGPSRASMMTGLYPDQTRIRQNAIRVRERLADATTLPQLFKEKGSDAVRIGKIYHYGVPRDIGTDGHDDPPSWTRVFNPRGRDKDDEPKIFSLTPGSFGGTLSWLAAEGSDDEQTDAIGAARAIEELRGFAASGERFFLAVGLYRPHTPYVAPKKYFDLYPASAIRVPEVPDGYLETLPKPARDTLTRKKDQVGLGDELAREAIRAYYASITFADAQVGRITAELDRLGLAESTVIVFTSDHGYHMGEHGYYQKTTLFENAARVPMIIAMPGAKSAGRSTRSLVELVDLYPTLAELGGLATPDFVMGKSLVALLDDPGASVRSGALTQFGGGSSLCTDRWRYTEWGPEGKNGAELYDHQKDPEEMVNLAAKSEHAATIAGLSRELRARVAAAAEKPRGLTQVELESAPVERP